MKSQITRLTITSGPLRKKPKAGDEKLVKGVLMIRQQVRVKEGWLVSSGRPVWEWVAKGSLDDRRHRLMSEISKTIKEVANHV